MRIKWENVHKVLSRVPDTIISVQQILGGIIASYAHVSIHFTHACWALPECQELCHILGIPLLELNLLIVKGKRQTCLNKCSASGVGKQSPRAKSTPVFGMVHELRTIFTFLNTWRKKWNKEEYFVTYEEYTKSKFLGPSSSFIGAQPYSFI